MELPNDTASANSSVKTLLPGFGRPLNYIPSKTDPDYIGPRFGSALSVPYFEEGGCMLPLTTVREFVMLQFMNTITDKPDWHVKINNPEITAKWKEEALASDHKDLTANIIDYCFDELRYKSTLIPSPPVELPPVVVYNGDVVKSDNVLSAEYKEELQKAVKTFEATIPERLKDWHPGSDEIVWDLVHPSLFPLVFGRTRVLENDERTTLEDCIDRCGQGRTSQVPDKKEAIDARHGYYMKTPYSRKFQWLPCEVDISAGGARITSYINNLHPQKEKPLYRLVEKLIDACIPLWDLTLAPLRSREFKHQRRILFKRVVYKGEEEDQDEEIMPDEESDDAEDDTEPPPSSEPSEQKVENRDLEDAGEIAKNGDRLEDKDSNKDMSESEDEADHNSPEDKESSEDMPEWDDDDDSEDTGEDEDEDEDESDQEGEDEGDDDDGSGSGSDSDSTRSIKSVIRPEPEKPFAPFPSPPKFSLCEEYGKHGLQVIVKLANIELTPEKPKYDGGSWHIEGQLNEHIVATALYYYSNTNITPSTLSFRQWFSDEDTVGLLYEQDDDRWLAAIYGCEQEGPSVQDVGAVDTREGRLLTFPNILQHRVGPFELADPSKPGHRKIVALFLVDPNVRVVSTAHVPCQQQEWWWDRVGEVAAAATVGATTPASGLGGGVGGLPRELQDHVLSDVDFPLSLKEAKELRGELMKERKRFTVAHSDKLEQAYTISLCEH